MAERETEGGASLETESAPPAEGPTSVLIAVGLMIVSAAFVIGGLRVPVPEGWQTAPGMLPVVLGASLFAMAAALLVNAIRAGALNVPIAQESGDTSLTRVSIAILLVGIFFFGLLAYLPFEVASALFLFAMLWLFWPEGSALRRLAVAVAIPILITLCFQGGFGIPLPGEGNLVLMAQYLWVTR